MVIALSCAGGALLLIGGILLVFFLSRGDGIAGKYVSERNPRNYVELRADGTFFAQEGMVGVTGRYRVEGTEITLETALGLAPRGRIEGRTIVWADGDRTTKLSSDFPADAGAPSASRHPDTVFGRPTPRVTPTLTPTVTSKPKVDVMFVVDVTGSMDWAIHGVRDGIRNFVDKFKSERIDVRVGLTVFRDEKPGFGPPDGALDDPWTYRFADGQYYTASPDEFKMVISRINAGGGGDEPENCMEGMRLAADKKGRDGAVMVQIMITDAHPKPWPNYKPNLDLTRKYLEDKGVRQLHFITQDSLRAIYAEMWNRERIKLKLGVETEKLSGRYYDLREIAVRRRSFDDILSDFKTAIVEEARREAGVVGVGK